MDIRCRKTTCEFNNGEVCLRNDIDVDKAAICETFKKDPAKTEKDLTKTMFDIAPIYAPFKHCEKIHIACEACCLFNICGNCNSNGITILDDEAKATCCNYLKINNSEFEANNPKEKQSQEKVKAKSVKNA